MKTVHNRCGFRGLSAILSLAFPLLGTAADPDPCISGIAMQDDDLYLATSFTNPFILEQGGPDGVWSPVGLFTDASQNDGKWLRAVQVDDAAAPLDDAIVFTPGEMTDAEMIGTDPQAGDNPWTKILQGLAGKDAVYGPLLGAQEPAGAMPVTDDAPAVLAGLGVYAFWSSSDGYLARWALNTNGVRTSSAYVSTNPMPPASWIFGGLADINLDGRPELFWSPTNTTMKTWFLDTNYQYSSQAVAYGSLCPPEYQFRASGDCSGDGYPDLFYQDVYFGYIDTWHMNPDGTLRIAQPTFASSINRSLQLRCAGDISGDGRVDLFFQNTNNGATEVWFLDTNGQQLVVSTICSTLVPRGWTLRGCGDVSGDGRVELFWQNTNGSTATWFMDTNGVRTLSRVMCASAVPSTWTMRGVVDVNADGRVELLWQSTAGATATWFLNTNGQRTLSRSMCASAVPATWTMRGASSEPLITSLAVEDAPAAPASSDVYVFWSATNGYLARWKLNTNGVRTSSAYVRPTPTPSGAWIFGGFADINADGRAELFWSPTNATMKTWFLDTNYQYSSEAVAYGSLCPREYQFRASGDSSGDGYPDLFYQDVYFGYIDTWHMNPDGTLRVAQPTYASSINRSLQLRCAGNIGGDGRVELFFQNTNSGATEVWFLDTNGQQLVVNTICTTAVPRVWTLRGCGDVNGDDRVELFWQSSAGATATWFMDTNGVRTVSRTMCASAVPSTWTMRGVVDVNADGRVELLWQSTAGATATWFLNTNGQRTLSRSMCASAVPASWTMHGGYAEPLGP